ncbi:hypothetical protein RND81_11G003200 [Saponaria officinalis]|uniref:Uncharacterized protein n=1 Tax=Saponaria officinalis TaxID=3572 RepID=A0AAW1HGF8_SAPOF
MKLNKSKKNKGKVHPSPSSSSSSSSSNDAVSNLNKLLPPTILTLISILSLQDKQVLSYMLSHSLSSSSSSSSWSSVDNNNKSGKKAVIINHKTPCFDCGCFDCYTTYWFRWDSSPHRELIHQAIEAFEEHLANSELPKKVVQKSGRKRENINVHNEIEKVEESANLRRENINVHNDVEKVEQSSVLMERESPERVEAAVDGGGGGGGDVEVKEGGGAQEENKKKKKMVQQQQQNKGLARKVLPDVIGLFNSRIWSLWGPNV